MKKFFNTTTKLWLWVYSICSVGWITWSYILATLGAVDIAESLASQVCDVIIRSFFCYVVSKTVENIFEKNDFGGLIRSKTQEETLENCPEEIVKEEIYCEDDDVIAVG